MSGQPTPPEIKRREGEREHDKLNDFQRYMNEAAIKAAELTLRMSLLINGGAAISLLTFIGSLPKDQKIVMANTLIWFASGVAIAATAIAFSYLTHYFNAEHARSMVRTWEHPYSEPGSRTSLFRVLMATFHIAALVFALASLAAFVWGMIEVRNAFAHLN